MNHEVSQSLPQQSFQDSVLCWPGMQAGMLSWDSHSQHSDVPKDS